MTDNDMIIALGSNLASSGLTPSEILRASLKQLETESLSVGAVSRWYQTRAFPEGSGPDFVNGAAVLRSQLAPQEVLEALHRIEAYFGREREVRWGPRVLDLDLIAAGQLVLPDLEGYALWRDLPREAQTVNAPRRLILPHPRVQDRAFVLVPMADVAPDWVHPVSGKSVREMVAELPQVERDAIKVISE
jgi:2-amino-4-hydroxy-6-hydroxymethyldihydropteridine diphosphokinase